MTVLANIRPMLYNPLIKTLALISEGKESNAVLSIMNNELISNSRNGGIFRVTFNGVFEQNTTLHIINPEKNIKLLGLIKGGENYSVVEAETTYVVTNDIFQVVIGKPEDRIQPCLWPNFNIETDHLSTIELEKENVENIRSALKTIGADRIQYHLDANYNIANIAINESDFKYYINRAANDTSIFYTIDFFPVIGEENSISIYKNAQNERIFLVYNTVIIPGIITIQYVEELNRSVFLANLI